MQRKECVLIEAAIIVMSLFRFSNVVLENSTRFVCPHSGSFWVIWREVAGLFAKSSLFVSHISLLDTPTIWSSKARCFSFFPVDSCSLNCGVFVPLIFRYFSVSSGVRTIQSAKSYSTVSLSNVICFFSRGFFELCSSQWNLFVYSRHRAVARAPMSCARCPRHLRSYLFFALFSGRYIACGMFSEYGDKEHREEMSNS